VEREPTTRFKPTSSYQPPVETEPAPTLHRNEPIPTTPHVPGRALEAIEMEEAIVERIAAVEVEEMDRDLEFSLRTPVCLIAPTPSHT